MVSFSRSDSRSTMSISCAWSLDSAQLLPQNLHRAGHRRQRIADLVRDAGRHLADGRQPLLQLRFALEPPDFGDVLERVEIAEAPVRQRQLRHAQARDDDRRRPAAGTARRCACCACAAGLRRAARTNSGGSCRISAAGWPTAPATSCPVICTADRLNVSRRFCSSAVARPLTRLSMTYWLKNCRSAISAEACSSRTSARRSARRASRRAAPRRTARTRSAPTVYCATLSDGRSPAIAMPKIGPR